MRESDFLFVRSGTAFAAALLTLGFSTQASAGDVGRSASAFEPSHRAAVRTLAGTPKVRIIQVQRRGRVMIPQRPVNVDSSPMIDTLNKALRALAATDRVYDGHREKAIKHINGAIAHLQLPPGANTGTNNAKNKSNQAAPKAATDESDGKTDTTPPDVSEATLRKARKVLFDAHHQLTDKASTAGRIRADAEVRVAIQEVDLCLKPPAAAGAASASASAAAPAGSAATSKPAPATGKPAR